MVVLAVVVMLGGACGPRQATPPPMPSGNQPPKIASLVAAKTQLYPSGNTEVQCIAQDADGDQLNFSWACTGGGFSGAGPSVIWKAPPNYGTYDITVTVDDGKGASAEASLQVTVGANQSPIISSFDASPSGVLYGGSTTLTCLASDPDGDAVRYSWSASEGNITGVGNKVTWIAPNNKGGDFNITVIVSDGKGGETMGNVMVTVSAVTKTVTIRPTAEETGTVDSEGDRDNSRTIAGDDEKNRGYCAFWSFDIWSLAGKKIENASLRFTTRSVVSDPFSSTTGLAGMRLWNVKYGDKLPGFWYTGTQLQHSFTLFTQPPTIVDVTPDIVHLAAAAASRFQVEALFMKKTNGNSVAQLIEWSEAILEVTYSER